MNHTHSIDAARVRPVHGAHRVTAAAMVAILAAGSSACNDPTDVIASGPFELVTAYSFPSLAGSDFIIGFDFGADGALWVITGEGRIIRLLDGVVDRYDAADIDSTGALTDLFIDGQGRPWVAVGGSVAFFEKDQWWPAGPDDLMGLAPVRAQVAVNDAGEILVAMGDPDAGGLLLWRDGAWRLFTRENSTLASPLTQEIEVGADGSFWVAAAQWQGYGGVCHLVDGEIAAVYQKADHGLLYNQVDDLTLGDGQVWLGYEVPIYAADGPDGGIQALSPASGAVTDWYPAATGLASNRVGSLEWSSAGELWFTTSIDVLEGACPDCYAAVGVLGTGGKMEVLSRANSDLDPDAYLPQIREGPDGEIYVALGGRRVIARVKR